MDIFLEKSLSQHFKLWEFVISQTAQRKGIDNSPNEIVINNLRILCETILEPARSALGPLRVSSGYRSEALNKAVGGSSTSAHQFGWAADILPINCSKIDFAKWVIHNVPFDQVILEFGTKTNPSWIHVSADPLKRKQVFQILNGTGYVPVII